MRGPGGQRRYTSADVERLALLHAATRAGRNISEVARLSPEALARLVEEDSVAREARAARTSDHLAPDRMVDLALDLTRALDSSALEAHLRRAAALLGTVAFLARIAVPTLRRVGDEWHAGRLTPAQEHLASSVLQEIILQAMRGFSPRENAPRVVIATPAGERHAIGAALVGAAAAAEGWNVVYLGTDLPAADIADAAMTTAAQVVAVSVVFIDDRNRVAAELRALRSRLPAGVQLIAGGSGAAQLAPELMRAGIRVGTSFTDLSAGVEQ